MRRIALAAAIAASAVILAAASGPRTYTITIADMAFGAPPVQLRVGDTVEWVNADIFEHTATARNGSFDVTLPPKARVRIVVKRAGKIAFYCRYHPGMVGVLTVAP